MENLKIKQINEAIKRMKLWKVENKIISNLKDKNKLYMSVHGQDIVELGEKEIEFVKRFEESTGYFVYHLILNNVGFGEFYTILYVSNYDKDWEYDIEDIKENKAIVYVTDLKEIEFKEFGCVGIKSNNGILKRIW